MTTAVVAHGRRQLRHAGKQGFECLALQRRVLGDRRVEIVHVGLVVTTVMDLHGLLVDHRHQSVVGVR